MPTPDVLHTYSLKDGRQVSVRNFEEQDFADIRELLQQHNMWYPEYTPELFADDMLVAKDEAGRIITFIRVYARDHATRELRSLITVPGSRGLGSATQLIHFVNAEIERGSLCIICAQKMIPFYLKIGFKMIPDWQIPSVSLWRELARERELFPEDGSMIMAGKLKSGVTLPVMWDVLRTELAQVWRGVPLPLLQSA